MHRLLLPSSLVLLSLLSGLLGAWLYPLVSGPRSAQVSAIDIGFAQAMSTHHQQAIAMAQLMQQGEPGPLLPLARQIASAQLLELGQMQGWLKLWNQPLQQYPPRMEWMLLGPKPMAAELREYLIDCERSASGMPGLATLEKMESLRHSTGLARDHLFLSMMIEHHRGGIPMARFAAQHAEQAVVRRLAQLVVIEQLQEIRAMFQALAVIQSQTDTSVRNFNQAAGLEHNKQ